MALHSSTSKVSTPLRHTTSPSAAPCSSRRDPNTPWPPTASAAHSPSPPHSHSPPTRSWPSPAPPWPTANPYGDSPHRRAPPSQYHNPWHSAPRDYQHHNTGHNTHGTDTASAPSSPPTQTVARAYPAHIGSAPADSA